MTVDIEERRKKILHIIINSYMNSGSPVSSRTICTHYRLGLCPASVRNVMADLEELGLITHLHTSAGRIPTDKGYRYYVDEILEHVGLTPQEQVGINKEFIARQLALEEIIRKTSKVLSDFTHYTGVVSQPMMKRCSFKRIQLTVLGDKKIYVNLLTNSGISRIQVVNIEIKIDAERLKRIENFMNVQLEDTPLMQLKTKLRRMMLQERNAFFYILKQAVELIDLSSFIDEQTSIYFEGISNILSFPEFEDSEKIRLFARVLDENNILSELIQNIIEEELEKRKVKVYIGEENPRNFMRDCSLVLSSYMIDEQTVGGLGVIGPRRMDYGKTIAAVTYVSEVLSEILTQFSI